MGDPIRVGNLDRLRLQSQTHMASVSVVYVALPWPPRFHRAAMPLTS